MFDDPTLNDIGDDTGIVDKTVSTLCQLRAVFLAVSCPYRVEDHNVTNIQRRIGVVFHAVIAGTAQCLHIVAAGVLRPQHPHVQPQAGRSRPSVECKQDRSVFFAVFAEIGVNEYAASLVTVLIFYRIVTALTTECDFLPVDDCFAMAFYFIHAVAPSASPCLRMPQ